MIAEGLVAALATPTRYLPAISGLDGRTKMIPRKPVKVGSLNAAKTPAEAGKVDTFRVKLAYILLRLYGPPLSGALTASDPDPDKRARPETTWTWPVGPVKFLHGDPAAVSRAPLG